MPARGSGAYIWQHVKDWRAMADKLAWRLDAHILMCDAIDEKSRDVYREYQRLAAEFDGLVPGSAANDKSLIELHNDGTSDGA